LCEEFDKLNLRIVSNMEATEMEIGSNLLQEIRKGQVEDEKIEEIKCHMKEEKSPGFSEDEEGVLCYKGRICVPSIKELKGKILREAHEPDYSIHPGGNKMYHDLKATYWWYGMKRDVAKYVALCDTCQRVKAEHQWPDGFHDGIAKDSVGIWFHLGNRGSTDKGGSLYIYQDHLLWAVTSRVIYVKDSLSAWSTKEDCV
jgi:hypothetical protein